MIGARINSICNICNTQNNEFEQLKETLGYAYSDKQIQNLVIDYFVEIGFPTIFLFFVSNESMESAKNFLMKFIGDDLIDRLVGTFLLHSFVFQCRFISIFQTKLSPKKCYDTKSIEKIFLETLSLCMSYLTKQQIFIVNELMKLNPEKAKNAVFKYFLMEFVKIWEKHYFFETTNTIIKINSNDQKITYEGLQFKNIVLEMLNDMVENNSYMNVMKLFNTEIYKILPNVGDIVYQDKFFTQISEVDEIISQHLCYNILKKGNRPKPGNSETFIESIFDIFKLDCYFKPNKSLTLQKDEIKKNKAIHDFLSENSSGLKEIQIMYDSICTMLKLHLRQYADIMVQKYSDTTTINDFVTMQLTEYTYKNFYEILKDLKSRGQQSLEEFINECNVQNNYENPKLEIKNHFNEIIKTKSSVSIKDALLNYHIELINIWKERYNGARGKIWNMSSPGKNINETQLAKIFISHVQNLGIFILLNKLSRTKIPPTNTINPTEKDIIFSVNLCSSETPYILPASKFSPDDPFILSALPSLKQFQNLLVFVEEGFKSGFKDHIEEFNIGDKILIFLKIEKQLSQLFDVEKYREIQLSDEKIRYREIVSILFNFVDPVYTRFFLFTALKIINNIKKTKPYIISNPNEFDKKVYSKLENLRKWLGIRPFDNLDSF